MENEILNYYANRAVDYEDIYSVPERQNDLAYIRDFLKKEFADMNIFEAACGTGYWTQEIAESANYILATDAGNEVLSLARSKEYPKNNVTHILADMYSLSNVSGNFQGAFAGFIWSHIPKNSLSQFISSINNKLISGGKAVFIDNNFIEGNSTPIYSLDDEGNTFQKRINKDGSEYIIIKNFPSEHEIRAVLNEDACDVQFKKLEFCWILSYTRK